MEKLVVDASAFGNLLLPREDGEWVEEIIQRTGDGSAEIHVPDIVNIEVGGLLRRSVKEGKISSAEACEKYCYFGTIPKKVYSYSSVIGDLEEIFQKSLDDDIYFYDCQYCFLAEKICGSLVTHDK